MPCSTTAVVAVRSPALRTVRLKSLSDMLKVSRVVSVRTCSVSVWITLAVP